MNLVNRYRTPGMLNFLKRLKERGIIRTGIFKENEVRVNKIKFFKDIPDYIEILIDYVDVTSLRCMNITTEIFYESIYQKLPELFEE